MAQPPIKLPPITRRLIDTLPILPRGKLPGGMSVFGLFARRGPCRAVLRRAEQESSPPMLPKAAPTPGRSRNTSGQKATAIGSFRHGGFSAVKGEEGRIGEWRRDGQLCRVIR